MGKVIALDFDGTLVENCWPEIGAPIPETIAAYHKERGEGTQFVLWTCRTGKKLDEALEWCKSQGLDFEAVNQNVPEKIEEFGEDCRKVSADEYWDDRAVKMPAEAVIPIVETKEAKAMPSIFRKPVQIDRGVYAMASVDGKSAEITMYGDIYEDQPVDWWTGKPIEGQFILQSEFLEDLNQISKCKDITIRMNSYGGDAVVAITIHNRLRELAQAGAKLTCIVDGVAMSGGSLIMCACDTVRVNPSSLIMIHKCWASLWGGYNADEMRELAKTYDAYDKAQVSIYKRKTGLSDTVLSHMMGDTTYMTGSEAVERGFADELIEDAEPLNIAASADGRSLFVRGRQFHLAPGMFAPDNIPTVTPEASAAVETNTSPENTGKGGNSMTLKEFREQNPEVAAQLEAEARAAVEDSGATIPPSQATNSTPAPAVNGADDPVQAERQRIQEIDALAGLFDTDTVNAAKYGDNACSAQEMVYRAAQTAAKQGKKFLADLEADTGDSGAGSVSSAENTPAADDKDKTPQQRMASAKEQVANLLGKKKEEK